MEPYRDWDQDSGVRAFEIGDDYIDVEFKTGVYRYTTSSAGPENLAQMKTLARSGDGLNSFINRIVKKGYSERLR